mmetsp:Transcript_46475/g.149087  ORF Transcript_46475/g.149087 Transcript_46475/m.149087 type:complete len:348 (+) Transcript_46475:944-1987(+)
MAQQAQQAPRGRRLYERGFVHPPQGEVAQHSRARLVAIVVIITVPARGVQRVGHSDALAGALAKDGDPPQGHNAIRHRRRVAAAGGEVEEDDARPADAPAVGAGVADGVEGLTHYVVQRLDPPRQQPLLPRRLQRPRQRQRHLSALHKPRRHKLHHPRHRAALHHRRGATGRGCYGRHRPGALERKVHLSLLAGLHHRHEGRQRISLKQALAPALDGRGHDAKRLCRGDAPVVPAVARELDDPMHASILRRHLRGAPALAERTHRARRRFPSWERAVSQLLREAGEAAPGDLAGGRGADRGDLCKGPGCGLADTISRGVLERQEGSHHAHDAQGHEPLQLRRLEAVQ